MADGRKNLAYAEIKIPPSPADSGITATLKTGMGARMPAVPFPASVGPKGLYSDPTNTEIVYVTDVTGDVVTFQRVQEGTTKRFIRANDMFVATITNKWWNDVYAVIGAGDATNAAAVVAEANARTAAVANEAALRTTGDAVTFANSELYTDNSVAAEAALRTSGDATNAAAVTTEAALRISGDAANAAAITAEAGLRSSGDATNATAITAETNARITAVASEASARATAVSNEASLRSAGDTATLTSAEAYTDSALAGASGFLRVSANLSDVNNVVTARSNLALGTAAVHDVPSSGDATNTQVVLGSDSRLGFDANAIHTGDAASGDLTGVYPNPTIAAGAVSIADLAGIPGTTMLGNNTAIIAPPTTMSPDDVLAFLGLGPISAPIPIVDGGTGQTTQQTALNALAGATTNHYVLAGNGTNVTLRPLTSADISGGGGGNLSGSVDNVVTAATSLTSYGSEGFFDLRRADLTQATPGRVGDSEGIFGVRFWGFKGSGSWAQLGGVESYTSQPLASTTGRGGLKFSATYDATGANLLTNTEHLRITNGGVIAANSLGDIAEMTGSIASPFFTSVLNSPTATSAPGTWDGDWVGRTVTKNGFSLGTWPWPDGTTVLAVSADGSTATMSNNATATNAGGTALANVGGADHVEGSTLRTKNFYIRHIVNGTGSDNAWQTEAFRISVDHTYDNDPSGTVGWQATSFIPGPAGLMQVDGTYRYGSNFAPGGGDTLGSILLNSSRTFQNISGEDSHSGGYINGVVTTDQWVAQGGNTYTAGNVLRDIPNEGFWAWQDSSILVGQNIAYSTQNIVRTNGGVFGTGIRAEVGKHTVVWATPFTLNGRSVTVTMTAGSATLVATSGTFLTTDVSVGVQGPFPDGGGVPPGTRLTYVDATHATMTQTASVSGTGVVVHIGAFNDTEIGFDHGQLNSTGRTIPFAKAVSGSSVITAYTDGTYVTPDTKAFSQSDVGNLLPFFGGIGHDFIVAVSTDGASGLTGSQITLDHSALSNQTGSLSFQSDWRTAPLHPRRNYALRGAGGVSLYPTGSANTTQDQHLTFYAPPKPGFFTIDGSYVFNYPSVNVPTFYNAAARVRLAQGGSVVTHATATAANTYINEGSSNLSLGGILGYVAANHISASGGAAITATVADFVSLPTVAMSGFTGSMTVDSATGFLSQLTTTFGGRVTARYGVDVQDASVAAFSSVGTQVGVRINPLSSGAHNIGVLDETGTVAFQNSTLTADIAPGSATRGGHISGTDTLVGNPLVARYDVTYSGTPSAPLTGSVTYSEWENPWVSGGSNYGQRPEGPRGVFTIEGTTQWNNASGIAGSAPPLMQMWYTYKNTHGVAKNLGSNELIQITPMFLADGASIGMSLIPDVNAPNVAPEYIANPDVFAGYWNLISNPWHGAINGGQLSASAAISVGFMSEAMFMGNVQWGTLHDVQLREPWMANSPDATPTAPQLDTHIGIYMQPFTAATTTNLSMVLNNGIEFLDKSRTFTVVPFNGNGTTGVGSMLAIPANDYVLDMANPSFGNMLENRATVELRTDGSVFGMGGVTSWTPTFKNARRQTSADGNTTVTSTLISSATASFTQRDVGATITGANIPANTTIASVQDSGHARMSANATQNATTTVFTIVANANLSVTTAINLSATYKADTVSVHGGASIDVLSNPTYTIANGGTLALGSNATAHTSFESKMTVASGSNLFVRTGLHIAAATGAGAIAAEYGVYIEALTVGTLKAGIHNLSSLEQLGAAAFGSTGQATVSTAGLVSAPTYAATGITGSTAASRYAGATTTGAPASGTFLTGDWITTQDGHIFVCTTGGTSGTWADVASGTVSANFSAKGDLLAGTGASAFTHLAVGTNGKALVADSTQTTGLIYRPVMLFDGTVTTAGGFGLANVVLTSSTLGPNIVLQNSDFSAPTASASQLGVISFAGSNDTSKTQYISAVAQGVATQLWTANAGGSRIELYVTPNNTVTKALGLVLDQDGTLGIGTNVVGTSNSTNFRANGTAVIGGTLTVVGSLQQVLGLLTVEGNGAAITINGYHNATITAGNNLLTLSTSGNDNSATPTKRTGASIAFVNDSNATWTSAAFPTRIDFNTVSAATLTRRMSLDNAGKLWFNPTIASNAISAGNASIDQSGNIASAASILSTSATAGIGYATGAGGAVTQLTSKTTAFPTISKVCGTLTWNAAALAASTNVTSLSSTNAAIAATDTVIFNHVSGGTLGSYTMTCTPGAGTWTLTLRNVSTGALSEAPVFNYAIIKAVTS